MDAIAGRFLSLGEAGAARSALQAAGIECWLADDAIVGLDWQFAQAVGLIKLRVREEDLERAREILELGSDVPADRYGAPLSSAARAGEDTGAPSGCPECGSPNFQRIPRFRIFLFVTILFAGIGAAVGQTLLAFTAVAGLAIALAFMPSRRCTACDHRWSPSFESNQGHAPPPDASDMAEFVCTRCGSIEVHDIDYRRLKAVPMLFTPAMLVVAPLWMTLPKRMCSQCGARY